MLGQDPHYTGIIKKAISSFGKLFSDIKIQRTNLDGVVSQTVNVPIAYAAKEKYLVRLDSDPNLANNTQTSLPRMSFEILGYDYDPSRKANKMNKISCVSNGSGKSTFSPVPYNISISLYLLTKTIEDALYVVEQILPIFTPDYTLSINAVPDMNIVNDVPIVLNSITAEDEYDGSFQERRYIIHTFNFTMKVNIFGSMTNSSIIKIVDVNFKEFDTEETLAQIIATPTPTDALIADNSVGYAQILEGDEITSVIVAPLLDFSGDLNTQFGMDNLALEQENTIDLN